MTVRFLKMARLELDEAVDYYNSEMPGLGDDFLAEVLNAIDRIREYPEAWPVFTRNSRRCLVRRFPYGILYQVVENGLLVAAVAHLHRNPSYWRQRAREVT